MAKSAYRSIRQTRRSILERWNSPAVPTAQFTRLLHRYQLSGVYWLFANWRLVYIGQSAELRSRVTSSIMQRLTPNQDLPWHVIIWPTDNSQDAVALERAQLGCVNTHANQSIPNPPEPLPTPHRRSASVLTPIAHYYDPDTVNMMRELHGLDRLTRFDTVSADHTKDPRGVRLSAFDLTDFARDVH